MWRTVTATVLVTGLVLVLLCPGATALVGDVRTVNITTLCETPLLLLVSADLVSSNNATATPRGDRHLVFLFSNVGAPGILLAYNSEPLTVDADCTRLGLGIWTSVHFVGPTTPKSIGTSLVFESIVEFKQADGFEDKVSFDGLNANEYDPERDEVVQELRLDQVKWATPVIEFENDGQFSYIRMASLDSTITLELYNTANQVNTLLGVLTPDATKLRMELRNFPFKEPESSRVAFQVTISDERGMRCPEFGYYTTPSDATFSKLFTRLVAIVQAVIPAEYNDVNAEGVVSYVGWPPLARLIDPGVAVPISTADDEVLITSLSSDGRPSDAAPAVVNITRLRDTSVPYQDVPFSIMKGVLTRRMVYCIKRAYVTVEAPVQPYMSWEPEIGAGQPALPSVPFSAYVTTLIFSAAPALFAVILLVASALRSRWVKNIPSHESRFRYVRVPSNQ